MTRTFAIPGRGRDAPDTAAPAAGRPNPRRRLRPPGFGSGRSAVAQFAISGLTIVVLLGLAGVELLPHAGSREALRDAKNTPRTAARGVAEPNLTPAVVRGNPAALARFDRIMRASVIQPPIVRVKIWSPDGRIVYSDEPRLIGARYPLDAADRAVLRSGGV